MRVSIWIEASIDRPRDLRRDGQGARPENGAHHLTRCASWPVSFVASVVLLSCYSAAQAEPPDMIVVVGDSIAYGTFDIGSPPGLEWPALLKIGITSDGTPIRVVNLSMGGASASSWAHESFASLYYTHVGLPNTYALVALGANDAIMGRHWYEFAIDLMAIVTKLNAAGSSKVILLLMPTENGATPAQAAHRADYNWIEQVLCDNNAVTPVELLCIDASEMPLDRNFATTAEGGFSLHPTAVGQRWLGRLVETELLAW